MIKMIAIPGGTFVMGSSKNEEGSKGEERPQHEVTIKSFLMGKYPITQAQWRAVAELPQVNQELQPNPSRFKGANRPVEQVSWYEAVEFCARLSNYTNKVYRLPTEAEWEYACRAGTTTPFHFGETITTDLANYCGYYTYGDGSKGQYREKTTDVGSFPPNPFVLHDMHGNVWEWCQDDWHENYINAPDDGSAWISLSNIKVLRGGSWFSHADYCRSASRYYFVADFDNINIGFRVVCDVA
ncbi:MAG: formylglycine-generating enzyme family protein [Dolichospermum sp.]